MPIEDLGEIISARILGGIPLVGKDEYIRDEIPAVYSEYGVMGSRFVLMGEPGTGGYYLETVSDWGRRGNIPPFSVTDPKVDVSALVGDLLKGIEGLTVSIDENRTNDDRTTA